MLALSTKFGPACLLAAGMCLVSCAPKAPLQPEIVVRSVVQDQTDLSRAALDRCKNATVLIGDFENGQLTETGTGFVCGDGRTIITNRHVVTGTDDVIDPCKVVFYSGTNKPQVIQVGASAISVLGTEDRKDPSYFKHDLALIRIPAKVAEPLQMGASEKAFETESAWSVGFPDGQAIRMDGTDLPSPTVHVLKVERIEKKGDKVSVLQLSGSSTYGDSGSPVVDKDGHVLGVMEARADKSGTIVYAVPTGRVDELLAQKPSPTLVAQEWAAPIGGDQEIEPAAPQGPPQEAVPAPQPSSPSLEETGDSALNDHPIQDSDLTGMTPRELTIVRNEPFARHGYTFRRPEIRSFFSHTEWYKPRTSDLEAVQRSLTHLEALNVDYIRAYQNRYRKTW